MLVIRHSTENMSENFPMCLWERFMCFKTRKPFPQTPWKNFGQTFSRMSDDQHTYLKTDSANQK